ncbi:MAG: hypothetical protein RIF41_40695 [Polyangiaceae bacterium]
MMMCEVTRGITMEQWLDEAACMAMVCTDLIDGGGDVDPTVGMRGVGLAAATIWRTTNGEPAWGKLDVEELRRATRAAGMDEGWQDMVLVVVCAFYGFLEQHGLVAWEQTRPIIDALAPYAEPATKRIMARVGAGARAAVAPSRLN